MPTTNEDRATLAGASAVGIQMSGETGEVYLHAAASGSRISTAAARECLISAVRLLRRGQVRAAAAEFAPAWPAIAAGDPDETYVGALLRRAIEDRGEPGWYALEVSAWIMGTAGGASDTPPDPPIRMRPRPTIDVEADNLTAQIEQAEAALIDAGLGLFQRHGRIVRVAEVEELDSAGETVLATRVVPVTETYLAELMGRVADWRRFNERTRQWVTLRCPAAVPRTYLGRAGAKWHLPHLAAVIHTPTLRADGGVLDVPGYDRPTRLFFDPSGTRFPEIPEWPEYADVEEALATLRGLLTDCAFLTATDEAVALSAILTAVARGAMPAAPMHAFTASTPGTGKSYLAGIITRIATGRHVGGFAYSGDEAETRKQIDSALLDGRQFVVFDNVQADLAGARLAEVLTQPTVEIRPLGRSEAVEVPCAAMFIGTGNNLVIAADLTRRVLLCRLDRRVERPELHKFGSNPLEMIGNDRGRYVAAALTILRAFQVGGDTPPPMLGGYEAWSERVRGALLWLGVADPAAAMDAGRESDPHRSELLAVLHQWGAVLGSRPVTSAELIAAAMHHVEFREALLAVAGAAGAINTGRLGTWLGRSHGRLADGMCIESATRRNGARRWLLHGWIGAEAPGPTMADPTLREMAT